MCLAHACVRGKTKKKINIVLIKNNSDEQIIFGVTTRKQIFIHLKGEINCFCGKLRVLYV